jgi:hypothetical protein
VQKIRHGVFSLIFLTIFLEYYNNQHYLLITKWLISVEEVDEDIEAVEEVAHQVFQQNSVLLGKGFALASPPTISQALQGVLPFR